MSVLLVDFGSGQAGLATVGYTQKQSDGTVVVARTTSGVTDYGNGLYGVSVAPNAATTAVQWDTGTTTPLYASEDVAAAGAAPSTADIVNAIDATSVKLDVAVSTRLATAGYTTPDNASIAAILIDTAEIGAAGAGLTALASAANLATAVGYIDTEVAAILAAVDTEVSAIKAKTDNLPAAPAATGDIPSAATIATAVWDEVL